MKIKTLNWPQEKIELEVFRNPGDSDIILRLNDDKTALAFRMGACGSGMHVPGGIVEGMRLITDSFEKYAECADEREACAKEAADAVNLRSVLNAAWIGHDEELFEAVIKFCEKRGLSLDLSDRRELADIIDAQYDICC